MHSIWFYVWFDILLVHVVIFKSAKLLKESVPANWISVCSLKYKLWTAPWFLSCCMYLLRSEWKCNSFLRRFSASLTIRIDLHCSFISYFLFVWGCLHMCGFISAGFSLDTFASVLVLFRFRCLCSIGEFFCLELFWISLLCFWVSFHLIFLFCRFDSVEFFVYLCLVLVWCHYFRFCLVLLCLSGLWLPTLFWRCFFRRILWQP